VPAAVTDDWADQAAHRLLAGSEALTPAPWTRDALTVLIETARRWPHIATGQLYPLLIQHPRLALHAGGTALAALAGLEHLDLAVLEAIEPHLPPGRHTDLDVGIAAVAARLADRLLAADPDPLTRSRTLDALAIRQWHAGLRRDALATGEAALRTWRPLALADPSYEPDLARSLSRRGIWLSEMGRQSDALTATKEAVGILRRLAADDSEAHEPDLARALTDLSVALSETRRRSDALTATKEAVGILRRLAADDSEAHEPDLARALTNLSVDLSEAGQQAEALTAVEEAVPIRRRLTRDNPAAHEPDLAHSLTILGALLSESGRQAESFSTTEEAVGMLRRLATDNPAAHEPDLARLLVNFSGLLLGLGRQAESFSTTEEAVGMLRRLATDNPAAHDPDLASALTNFSLVLSETGREAEALAAIDEAVKIRRRLAADNPAAHELDLARSLLSWAWVRSEAGTDLSGALRGTGEAIEIFRTLIAGSAEVFGSQLRETLRMQARLLLRLGRLREAQEIHGWLAENAMALDARRAIKRKTTKRPS
jgi:tetratricopeptide (TPR) repeat protein